MKRTPLYDRHVAAGARMIDFGGWDMPVTYTDIASEHETVRTGAGLFDLCHMGRLSIRGAEADALVQKAQTNDLDKMEPGQIRYAMVLQDDGGILDDILVHRREEDVFLVVNASNRDRIRERLITLGEGLDAHVVDLSEEMGMVAVQGPQSAGIVAGLCDIDIGGLGYYRLDEGTILGTDGMVTRTGYTGEDGFELYVDAGKLVELWDAIVAKGVKPCGLGARDTLRLEAGMPLYGHEIDETVNPVEAGLLFGVRLKKPDYPGRDVVAAMKKNGPKRRIAGFVAEGRRIPRQGYDVVAGDRIVGRVASGSWSPTFECAIATALVEADALDGDAALEVDVRGRRVAVRQVELPFYKRDGTGSLNTKSS